MMQARVAKGKVSITSRQAREWVRRFPFIAGAFEALPVIPLVTDGEVVSLSENGSPDFDQLQTCLPAAMICVGRRVVACSLHVARPSVSLERTWFRLLSTGHGKIMDHRRGRVCRYTWFRFSFLCPPDPTSGI